MSSDFVETDYLSELCWVSPPVSMHARMRPMTVASTGLLLPALRGRGIPLQTPILARSIPWERYKSDICQAIVVAASSMGIAIVASTKDFEHVSAASLPRRIERIWGDQFPATDAFESADAIEVMLCDSPEAAKSPSNRSDSLSHTWPLDVPDVHRLRKKISLIRELTGGNTPVGLTIPAGSAADDVALAIDAGVDFLTLDCRTNRLAGSLPLPWTIATARRVANEKGKMNFPILLDASFKSGEEVAKCIALGASGFDGSEWIVAVAEEQQRQYNASMASKLSGYTLPGTKNNIAPGIFIEKLQAIVREVAMISSDLLKPSIDRLSIRDLAALTDRAQRWTRAPLLE